MAIDFNIITCITSVVSLAVSVTGETEFVGELDVLQIFGLDQHIDFCVPDAPVRFSLDSSGVSLSAED
jgi:hypothetical protein